eukprot:jgi/Mesvir1/23169/Mv22642-RA.1
MTAIRSSSLGMATPFSGRIFRSCSLREAFSALPSIPAFSVEARRACARFPGILDIDATQKLLAAKPEAVSGVNGFLGRPPAPLVVQCDTACPGGWAWSRQFRLAHSFKSKSRLATTTRSAVSVENVGSTEENVEGDASKQIVLYNTMSRSKEVFRPLRPGRVSMYVCGVTVYDYSHIGHARVYVAFDVLYRYLAHRGFDVIYCRNFTDVDDKILARALQLGEDPLALSQRFIDEFHVDMAALRCLPPTHEPKVSGHIPGIISMIEAIIANGSGYLVEGGDVYFSVDSFPSYGALSGRKQSENRAGERVDLDARKKNPADFALWKAAKEGEGVSWDSPWGRGRPGWHIECSAMMAQLLGPSIDIHGGGQDLIFPHHENEIAQNKAACSHSHVGYWLHNGFVTIDSEKMSKSLGNYFTIREVLAKYHPIALRWLLVSTHYRSPINYSKQQLEQASERVFYIYQTLESTEGALAEVKAKGEPDGPVPAETVHAVAASLDAFHAAMADDLSTPQAVAVLSEPLRVMNDLLNTKKGRKEKGRLQSLAAWQGVITQILGLLGINTEEPSKALLELKETALRRVGLSADELASLINERLTARQEKNFARSDAIRDQLAAQGVLLMDKPGGTDWQPVAPPESNST